VTPAQELAAAAQTLLDLADDTDDDINTNPYWHSRIAPRHHWFGHGIENAVGGPAGQLAGLLNPTTARLIAKWLRSWTPIELREDAPMPEDATAALAIAREINRSQP
jgi:hypothetical protein